MWRKFQKDAVSSVVLPHWSSFNWTLGLTVMMHSLTGGDGAPLWLANWTDQNAAVLVAGKTSKLELDLEGALLYLYDRMGK